MYLFENKELSTKSASIFNHSHLKAKEREGIELLELYINWIEYAQGQQLSHRAKLQVENNIYDSKLPFSWFYR